MSLRLALVAALSTVNAWRLAPGVPGATARERVRVAALGAGGLVVLGALVGAGSGPVLGAASLTGPTARIAAGVAVTVVAVRDLLSRPPSPEPALAGDAAAVVPVLFPHLATPGLVLLMVSVGHDRGVAVVAGLAVAAGASLVVVAALPAGWVSTRWWRAVGSLVSASAVLAGVGVTVSGVLDI